MKQRKLITTDSLGTQVVIDLSNGTNDAPTKLMMEEALKEMRQIRIPRRPAWDGQRSGKDQRLLENVIFH